MIGDDDGNIQKTNTGTDDNGSPIFYSLLTRWWTFDGLFATRKNISKMSVIHKNGEGGLITFQVDDDNVNKWRKLFQIGEANPTPKTVNIKGQKVRFRLQGTSVGEPFIFSGFEVLDISSELIG